MTRSSIDGFRNGMVEQWNNTSQIMEHPGTVRLAALCIALLISLQGHQTKIKFKQTFYF